VDQNIAESIDFAVWVGRSQAFGQIANQCSAAQAECLKTIRESGSYKQLGLTWDEFCPEYTGLSRQRVDAIIANLEEFGATYFLLSEIVRISPEAYRQLARLAAVKGDTIEIAGERIAIGPENAGRIRRAVLRMRSDLQKARAEVCPSSNPPSPVPNLANLTSRLDLCLEEISRVTDHPLEAPDETALRGLIRHAGERLKRISRSIQRAQPVLAE
jgi:hypothetical protein